MSGSQVRAAGVPTKGFAGPVGLRTGGRLRAVGAAASLVVHALAAATLSGVAPISWRRPPDTVELEVVEQPPPPPLVEPPPALERPPPEPKPRPALPRRVVAKIEPPKEEPPPPAAPPPNVETPPPDPTPTPPAFGVTLDSVVSGDSAVAVPVGNTVMTAVPKPAGPSGPPAVSNGNDMDAPFSPVADVYIAEENQLLEEVKADYPAEARRLGIEGHVLLRVGIDRRGRIRSVKVIKRFGYGFDEAAEKALWRSRFTAAKTQDGKPVDRQITYKYKFQLPR